MVDTVPELNPIERKPIVRTRGNSTEGRSFLHPSLQVWSKEQYGPSDIWIDKLCIVLVGLPARGKSYISHKLRRYLKWMGYKVEIFNAGNYRRKRGKDLNMAHDSKFFDPTNKDGSSERERIAEAVLEDMLDWLCNDDDGGHVGMFDATNSTPERRAKVRRMCEDRGVQCLYIESICDDPAVLEPNIKMKLKSPDYIDKDPEWARQDFLQRLAAYEKAYQTITDAENLLFIKMINCGRRIIAEKIEGYLLSTVALYLMNFHVQPRLIYLARNGATEADAAGKLGYDDEPLNADGEDYAQKLCDFILSERREQHLDSKSLWVWTAGSVRSKSTVKHLPVDVMISHLRILNNPRYGKWEGLTRSEIREGWPELYAAWEADPLYLRIPGGGDAFSDVMERIRPLLIELERQKSSLFIVASDSILRALYGYFMDVPKSECPKVPISKREVIRLRPMAYTCEETRITL